MNPIDLLPIKRPLEDDVKLEETFFYDNVIKPIIPDILRMESTGIPIDLNKVKELDNTIINVIDKVYEELSNNKLMAKFLQNKYNIILNNKKEELENKKKSYEEFIKPFNLKNKTHRTYVVNEYLRRINKLDMIMDEWSIKELKKLNSLIASKFINDLLNNKDISYKKDLINSAMINLAKDKADLYNKNKIDKKKDLLSEKDIIKKFNPASSKQIREFFEYYGIESESTTATGNPKWDRDELERLSKLLNTIIEDKE